MGEVWLLCCPESTVEPAPPRPSHPTRGHANFLPGPPERCFPGLHCRATPRNAARPHKRSRWTGSAIQGPLKKILTKTHRQPWDATIGFQMGVDHAMLMSQISPTSRLALLFTCVATQAATSYLIDLLRKAHAIDWLKSSFVQESRAKKIRL